jgi:hypothetical protein
MFTFVCTLAQMPSSDDLEHLFLGDVLGDWKAQVEALRVEMESKLKNAHEKIVTLKHKVIKLERVVTDLKHTQQS